MIEVNAGRHSIYIDDRVMTACAYTVLIVCVFDEEETISFKSCAMMKGKLVVVVVGSTGNEIEIEFNSREKNLNI